MLRHALIALALCGSALAGDFIRVDGSEITEWAFSAHSPKYLSTEAQAAGWVQIDRRTIPAACCFE